MANVDVTGYLDVEGFSLRSIMPRDSITRLENKDPGWLQTKLNAKSAWVNARLWKRYNVPFVAPVPDIVLDWVAALVTQEAYSKLGFNPSSEQDKAAIIDPADQARDEIEEAAKADDGLFELPLKQNTTEEGVERGGPFCYAEQSPYRWTTLQRDAARAEDADEVDTLLDLEP